MSIIYKLFIILDIKLILISCIIYCNKQTYLPPESEYHCSGLVINQGVNPGDTHCCLSTYEDEAENKTISRCSSISQSQFNDLDAYIIKKSAKLKNIDIKCRPDQKLYCSNVVLDEEDIDDCSKLAISIEDDSFCCRWIYRDSSSRNKKVNNYCASINEYEYLTIDSYVLYKNNHPQQRYDDLTIDCLGSSLKIKNLLKILFIFL